MIKGVGKIVYEIRIITIYLKDFCIDSLTNASLNISF